MGVVSDPPPFPSEYTLVLGALIVLMAVIYGGFISLKGEVPTRVRHGLMLALFASVGLFLFILPIRFYR